MAFGNGYGSVQVSDRKLPNGPVLFYIDGVLVDSAAYWYRFEDGGIFETVVAEASPAHEEATGMACYEIYEYRKSTYGTTVTKAEFVDRSEERAESLYGSRSR